MLSTANPQMCSGDRLGILPINIEFKSVILSHSACVESGIIRQIPPPKSIIGKYDGGDIFETARRIISGTGIILSKYHHVATYRSDNSASSENTLLVLAQYEKSSDERMAFAHNANVHIRPLEMTAKSALEKIQNKRIFDNTLFNLLQNMRIFYPEMI
jgi:hypothetical protein